MITKDQFANSIIDNFCKQENITRGELSDSHITCSSSLAVAMNHLNMIKDEEMKKYAETRGGTFIMFYDNKSKEVRSLSTRELLELLPEEI